MANERARLRYEEVPDEWVEPLATMLARPWGEVRQALTVAAPIILALRTPHQRREVENG